MYDHSHSRERIARRDEIRLLEDGSFLMEAMNALPDLVYVVDPEGHLLYWNRSLSTHTGYDDGEIALMQAEDFFPQNERQRIRESIRRAWVQGKESIETQILTKSGLCVPYELRSSILRDGNGIPVALCGSARDLSERRSFEATLTEQTNELTASIEELRLRHEETQALNQKLELLLASTRTRFLLTDENCAVRYADPETQRLYGSLANQKCNRYLFLSSDQCLRCPKSNPANHDQSVVTHFTLPLEQHRIFQRTSVPIRSQSGERMIAAVLVDVTEYKALEVQLNQAQKLEAVGQLAAGIAHEINTPTQFVGDNTRFLREGFQDLERVLTALDLFLEQTKQGANDSNRLEDLRGTINAVDAAFLRSEIPVSIDQTLEGVEQIGRIVRAMKEFSHPGSASKQSIDINRAVENTLTVSRGEWKHVARLITDFQPDLPAVPCFPGELNQAVLNIVVNAAQAIADSPSDNGTITVRTRQIAESVEIQIADTGPGIPEGIRSRVFDHFFTTKEVGKGTGQGLTIAHTVIVEKHGGSLDFHSEPGQGTTFVIRLPLKDINPASSPRES